MREKFAEWKLAGRSADVGDLYTMGERPTLEEQVAADKFCGAVPILSPATIDKLQAKCGDVEGIRTLKKVGMVGKTRTARLIAGLSTGGKVGMGEREVMGMAGDELVRRLATEPAVQSETADNMLRRFKNAKMRLNGNRNAETFSRQAYARHAGPIGPLDDTFYSQGDVAAKLHLWDNSEVRAVRPGVELIIEGSVDASVRVSVVGRVRGTAMAVVVRPYDNNVGWSGRLVKYNGVHVGVWVGALECHGAIGLFRRFGHDFPNLVLGELAEAPKIFLRSHYAYGPLADEYKQFGEFAIHESVWDTSEALTVQAGSILKVHIGSSGIAVKVLAIGVDCGARCAMFDQLQECTHSWTGSVVSFAGCIIGIVRMTRAGLVYAGIATPRVGTPLCLDEAYMRARVSGAVKGPIGEGYEQYPCLRAVRAAWLELPHRFRALTEVSVAGRTSPVPVITHERDAVRMWNAPVS